MLRCFGARAPVLNIAWQFIDDCTDKIYRDHDLQYPYIRFSSKKGPKESVHFEYFRDIEEGLDTAVIEWWLNDIDFPLEYQQYTEWICELEDRMEKNG
jgi:hypothetical protein